MRRALLFIVTVMLLVAGCAAGPDRVTSATGLPDTLRVGLIPNIAPEAQRAKYQPFAEYLQRKLGTKVELFVAADYAGVVAALAGNRIDVAYLGGLTYAQAERQVGLTPMVTEIDRETGTPKYLSAIVVKADSPIREVGRDIVAAGRSFAFGDISSTSGSLYPRIMLTGAGARCSAQRVQDCPPLSQVRFTGGHDSTAAAVLSGQVDAGGLELRVLHRLERDGKVPTGALRVVEQREVQGYPWVIRTALGEPALRAVTDAFTSLTDPALLDLLRAKSYVPVRASDYAEIRQRGTELGLVTTGGR